jgi:hypothetical protein
MSRSRKKPYYKDHGLSTHEYWSAIRHEWKQKLNENYYNEDFHLRNPKSIKNDWDYCDYSFFVNASPEGKECTHFSGWSKEEQQKCSRK